MFISLPMVPSLNRLETCWNMQSQKQNLKLSKTEAVGNQLVIFICLKALVLPNICTMKPISTPFFLSQEKHTAASPNQPIAGSSMLSSCRREPGGLESWQPPLPCSWLWECTWWRSPCRAFPPFSCLLPQGFPHLGPFVTSQLIFWVSLCSRIHQTWDRCPLWEAWGHLQWTEEHLEGISVQSIGWDSRHLNQGRRRTL